MVVPSLFLSLCRIQRATTSSCNTPSMWVNRFRSEFLHANVEEFTQREKLTYLIYCVVPKLQSKIDNDKCTAHDSKQKPTNDFFFTITSYETWAQTGWKEHKHERKTIYKRIECIIIIIIISSFMVKPNGSDFGLFYDFVRCRFFVVVVVFSLLLAFGELSHTIILS